MRRLRPLPPWNSGGVSPSSASSSSDSASSSSSSSSSSLAGLVTSAISESPEVGSPSLITSRYRSTSSSSLSSLSNSGRASEVAVNWATT